LINSISFMGAWPSRSCVQSGGSRVGAAAICPVQPGGDSGVTPSFVFSLLLLAEGEAAPVNPLAGVMQLALPLVMIFFMYVMLIQRPQKREQEKRQSMLSALKKNDHVLLSSGIYGVVTNVRDDADEVTVRVDETTNAKLKVTRAAVAKVITDEPAEAASDSK
jgi:preprotein translocase subunit YajC